MGVIQLKMMLGVVVGLVVVVVSRVYYFIPIGVKDIASVHVPFVVVVFAGAVVAAVMPVGFEVDAVPCDAGVLFSHEPRELQGVVQVHPAEGCHSRLHVCLRVTDVPVREVAGICGVEIDAGLRETGACRDCRSEGVIGAVAEICRRERAGAHRCRAHIYARAECSRTIC